MADKYHKRLVEYVVNKVRETYWPDEKTTSFDYRPALLSGMVGVNRRYTNQFDEVYMPTNDGTYDVYTLGQLKLSRIGIDISMGQWHAFSSLIKNGCVFKLFLDYRLLDLNKVFIQQSYDGTTYIVYKREDFQSWLDGRNVLMLRSYRSGIYKDDITTHLDVPKYRDGEVAGWEVYSDGYLGDVITTNPSKQSFQHPTRFLANNKVGTYNSLINFQYEIYNPNNIVSPLRKTSPRGARSYYLVSVDNHLPMNIMGNKEPNWDGIAIHHRDVDVYLKVKLTNKSSSVIKNIKVPVIEPQRDINEFRNATFCDIAIATDIIERMKSRLIELHGSDYLVEIDPTDLFETWIRPTLQRRMMYLDYPHYFAALLDVPYDKRNDMLLATAFGSHMWNIHNEGYGKAIYLFNNGWAYYNRIYETLTNQNAQSPAFETIEFQGILSYFGLFEMVENDSTAYHSNVTGEPARVANLVNGTPQFDTRRRFSIFDELVGSVSTVAPFKDRAIINSNVKEGVVIPNSAIAFIPGTTKYHSRYHGIDEMAQFVNPPVLDITADTYDEVVREQRYRKVNPTANDGQWTYLRCDDPRQHPRLVYNYTPVHKRSAIESFTMEIRLVTPAHATQHIPAADHSKYYIQEFDEPIDLLLGADKNNLYRKTGFAEYIVLDDNNKRYVEGIDFVIRDGWFYLTTLLKNDPSISGNTTSETSINLTIIAHGLKDEYDSSFNRNERPIENGVRQMEWGILRATTEIDHLREVTSKLHNFVKRGYFDVYLEDAKLKIENDLTNAAVGMRYVLLPKVEHLNRKFVYDAVESVYYPAGTPDFDPNGLYERMRVLAGKALEYTEDESNITIRPYEMVSLFFSHVIKNLKQHDFIGNTNHTKLSAKLLVEDAVNTSFRENDPAFSVSNNEVKSRYVKIHPCFTITTLTQKQYNFIEKLASYYYQDRVYLGDKLRISN